MKFRDLKFGEHFMLDNKEYICSRSSENPYIKCVSVDLQDSIEVDDNQEVTKLNSYRVAGEYTCVFEVEVYAESLEDAIDIIENDDGTYVKIQGDYLDDSFYVNHELTESLNELQPDFE